MGGVISFAFAGFPPVVGLGAANDSLPLIAPLPHEQLQNYVDISLQS